MNSSNFNGVQWSATEGKWSATIRIRNRIRHLGYCSSEVAAAQLANRAERDIYGRFATINTSKTLPINQGARS